MKTAGPHPEHDVHAADAGGESGRLLRVAAGLMEAGEAFVLATVVRVQGSTPRGPGARLVWRPGAGGGAAAGTLPNGAVGTVGGGRFEEMVLQACRACCERGESVVERLVLGADADQCCGGVMEVFLEYHAPAATLVLFGAGHVAEAVARVLGFAGLRLVVVDDRAEWNSAERFARARRVAEWAAGVRLARAEAERTMALVMTCSHETDFELLRGLLADGGEPPALVGLIGSRSKRACLLTRLTGAGVDAPRVERVVCPIGVGDTGKEPRAIAVSIAAQVLMEAKKLGPA